METPTFIFAEAIPRLNMHLQSIGWDNLVQINFDCRDAFQREGYVPMSELLAFITDHRIGTEEGYPEQTPQARRSSRERAYMRGRVSYKDIRCTR